MYCPGADAVAAWVSSLPSPPIRQPAVVTPLVRAAASPIPVSGGAPSPVRVVCSPVRVSSVLSPGPIYQGPDPDPSLVVWPLSEFPDWPINDDWRDFAFEPVVFRSPVFSSEQSNNNNSDHDGP